MNSSIGEIPNNDSNGNDSSCYIVENKSDVIEIDDEDQKSQIEVEVENLSQYEIVDQTYGSDCNDSSPMPESSQKNNVAESPSKTKSTERLLVDIKFHNKKTYFSLHEDFIDVIKKFYKKNIEDIDIIDDASNNRVCVAQKLVKKSDAFLIDTTPTIDLSNTLESTPRYTSLSKSTLTFDKNKDDEEHLKTPSAYNCFNCGKNNHSLRDCPEPRNMTKIRKARNDFNKKELRYVDDENEFSKFTPGKLSDELKAALGVSSNQIPLHVYKMRLYKYPPAWYEEAKVYNSGLSLFVEKDKVQSHEGENRQFKIDIEKIIEYPGFNVMPETPFVDKHLLLNLPSMQECDLKEAFIQSLGKDVVVNGYKKRKLKDIGSLTNDIPQNLNTEADMEIESSDDEIVNPNPPGTDDKFYDQCISNNERSKSSDEEGEIQSVPSSPTEDDLQNERNNILSQLDSSNTDSQSKSSLKLFEETTLENSVNENIDNSSKDLSIGQIETTLFGATVLPSFSSFDNLPTGEKFKEGVSDVIAFENLADSTGAYEKMKGLIKKVRVTLKDQRHDE
ncbi:hypothetical protein PVAND_006898 [Polypedilum vanderplanki]|uniref:CCHC-type domain-containing protein n=1 Tax=Polypedilum vanderplanki TaxID=319348 RepID=A0A9J6C5K5_POLVA|nr:hypothetical protein PVAND_006898 [Polypedilum vanderplanki]